LEDLNPQALICRVIVNQKTNPPWKLGLGIDNPCSIDFFEFSGEQGLLEVNGWHFLNPGIFSYVQSDTKMLPQFISSFFFHCCIYSLLWFGPHYTVQRVLHSSRSLQSRTTRFWFEKYYKTRTKNKQTKTKQKVNSLSLAATST
jgi:hypothetical protein